MTTDLGPFLSAAAGRPAERVPIWIMRQAGRYLPQYQEIRKKHDFLTMCHTPELTAEVTMQPVREFDMDAAIFFCDILIPFEPMGIDVSFIDGKGPQLSPHIRSRADVEKLVDPDFETSTAFVSEALKLVRAELAPEKALIGFAGAPWTLMCYAVEGMGSKNWGVVKELIYSEPATAHLLLEKITRSVARFLRLQIQAGADVVQIFDSWADALSQDDYREFSLPYIKLILEELADLDVPKILFSRDGGAFMDANVQLPINVLAVDWRVNLAAARHTYANGNNSCWQGNLDPLILRGSRSILLEKARKLLDENADKPGWIFNLGHGITPPTPVENVRALVDLVHSYKGGRA